MKFASWPQPPVHSSRTVPEIPSRFKLFGLEYKVIGGNPYLDIPSKPLDRKHLKECVDESLQLFLKTIKTLDGTILNEIRDLHIHINEEINLAKAFEGPAIVKECKNDKIKEKIDILNKIEDIITK